MAVRKIRPGDRESAVGLARRLGLDYPGLENDAIWVAEDGGEIVGLVALKAHADCLELCALGVDPRSQGQGVGLALVEALMAEAPGDVHLATIIPGFFEGCGFHIIETGIPATFPAKRRTSWCEGCPRERCRVMRRAKP
jgi:N-acetylglutamate synthase-like GNAT family acetyltransferase